MERVFIHPSQQPAQLRLELLRGMRERKLNHKFLYDGEEQTRRWLALHQACSPARTDPECLAIYDRAFQAASTQLAMGAVHVIGLGSGGGQKEARLLEILNGCGFAPLHFTPVDVGEAMVRAAADKAATVEGVETGGGVVCDLTQIRAAELVEHFFEPAKSAQKVLTFFGLLPNFEPGVAFSLITHVTTPEDIVLLSANMVPGVDTDARMQRILPLYDNALTRHWLMGFLESVGIAPGDGTLEFSIETGPSQVRCSRVIAHFAFSEDRKVQIEGHTFRFSPGDRLQVFFSYRHTVESMMRLLNQHGLELNQRWITPGQDEGVFLVRKR